MRKMNNGIKPQHAPRLRNLILHTKTNLCKVEIIQEGGKLSSITCTKNYLSLTIILPSVAQPIKKARSATVPRRASQPRETTWKPATLCIMLFLGMLEAIGPRTQHQLPRLTRKISTPLQSMQPSNYSIETTNPREPHHPRGSHMCRCLMASPHTTWYHFSNTLLVAVPDLLGQFEVVMAQSL